MRLESHRVFGLDLMRASAIGLVLLSHATLWFADYPACFEVSLLAGYFGVELFFVLSGFLIGGILLRGLTGERSTFTLGGFWQRRWLRTLPNYFLFLGVNVVLAAWLFHSTPSVLPYFFFVQNITARPPRFFVESWSLAVEEWFYLLLPVLFLLALRLSRRRFQLLSLAVIGAVITAVTLSRCLYVFAMHPVWLTGVRMVVVYRLDACMFGVLMAWANHFHPAWLKRNSQTLFGGGIVMLACLGLMPFVLPAESLFPHTIGFTFTSFAGALLLPMLAEWKSSGSALAKPIEKASVWSYSLYLVNLPVFAVIFEFGRPAGPLACAGAFLFFSVILSAFVYHFYERPFMNLRERFVLPLVRFSRLDEPLPVIADR